MAAASAARAAAPVGVRGYAWSATVCRSWSVQAPIQGSLRPRNSNERSPSPTAWAMESRNRRIPGEQAANASS